jgi:hypothetical protein
METENTKNNSDSSQITFKCSPEERQEVDSQAAKFKMSNSEYIRIKVFDDDEQVFRLKSKNSELDKENKELQVKLSRYKESERSPDNIVLQLTPEVRELFEKLFKDLYSSEKSVGNNIILFLFLMIEFHFKALVGQKDISLEDVQNVQETFRYETEENEKINEVDSEDDLSSS